MKTLFLVSTLFLTDFANAIATGIDKLDWHQHSKKSGIQAQSTDAAKSSLMLFRNGLGTNITDPFAPSNRMLFSSYYRGTHAPSVGNSVLSSSEGKSVDIASINFLVPKEKSVRYESGAIIWEVKI